MLILFWAHPHKKNFLGCLRPEEFQQRRKEVEAARRLTLAPNLAWGSRHSHYIEDPSCTKRAPWSEKEISWISKEFMVLEEMCMVCKVYNILILSYYIIVIPNQSKHTMIGKGNSSSQNTVDGSSEDKSGDYDEYRCAAGLCLAPCSDSHSFSMGC